LLVLLPPRSYYNCVYQFEELDNKIVLILLLSSCYKYKVIRETTDSFFMRGNLHEIEVIGHRQSQINTYKTKLKARLSLSKRGSILASDTLEKKKVLQRAITKKTTKTTCTKIIRFENKAKKEFKEHRV
jgi:hypothetical protein